MSTEKAVTAYGEVEYETVECDSCGHKVVKEDADRFVVGELQSEKYWDDYTKYEFRQRRHQTGWACPHCRDDPIAFPRGTYIDVLTCAKAVYVATALFFAAIAVMILAGA
jgi:Zn ribbon nucleic-acid-binding protein